MAFFNAFRVFVALFALIAIYFTVYDRSGQDQSAKQTQRRSPVPYTPPPSQCVSTGQVSLTFDNGISTTYTPIVLDALKAANATATFHISAQWLGTTSLINAIVKRIYTDGHIIGMAWYGSLDPRNMSVADLTSTLAASSTSIYNAAGVHPKFVRFPFSMTNQFVVQTALNMGLLPTTFNIDGADYLLCPGSSNPNYTASDVAHVYQAAMQQFKDAGNLMGSFIGLSTDLCPTGTAAQLVIKTARDFGYVITPLDQCVGSTRRYRTSATSDDPSQSPTTAKDSSSAGGSKSDAFATRPLLSRGWAITAGVVGGALALATLAI